MSTYFEHNLENLRSRLLLMGQLANESLKMSIKALLEGDTVLAKSVRENDETTERPTEVDGRKGRSQRWTSLELQSGR